MTDLAMIPKGAIVIDDSFSPPTDEQLIGAGVAGEIRYFSRPLTNAKNWTRELLARRHAIGVATLGIHEQAATDHLGGPTAGRDNADTFARDAEAVGYPLDAGALVACDTSPTNALADYCGAFEQRIRELGANRVGAYVFGPNGIQMLLDNRVCTDIMWQAYAGSAVNLGADYARQVFGGMDVTIETPPTLERVQVKDPDTGKLISVVRHVFNTTVQVVHNQAHAFQRYGYAALFEGPFAPNQVDENIVLRPFPMWLPGGATPATPTPTSEDTMQRLIAYDDAPGDIYLASDWDPTRRTCFVVAPADEATIRGYQPLTGPYPPAGDGNPWGVEIVEAAARARHALLPLAPGGGFYTDLHSIAGQRGPAGERGPKGDTGPAGPAATVTRSAIIAAIQ